MSLIAVRSGRTVHADASQVKTLVARVGVAAHYMTFESPVGTDYQVPAGKTLTITRMVYWIDTAGTGPILGYGDTGVPDQAAAPTNFVQQTQEFMDETTYKQQELNVLIVVPALKFPCMLAGVASSRCGVLIEGYEA